VTYLAVLVGQIFFRADSVADAVTLLRGMGGAHGSGLPLPIPPNNLKYLGFTHHWVLDHQVFVVSSRDAYNAMTLPLAKNLLLGVGLAIIAFGAPNVYQIMGEWSPALTKVQPSSWKRLRWQPTWLWAVGAGVLLFAASLRFGHAARFLYFQF
jgi:hypothetical protein